MATRHITEPVTSAEPLRDMQRQRARRMRIGIATFVATVQLILLLAHWFVYQTWAFFGVIPDRMGARSVQSAMALLSVSFVAASLLAFRYYNTFVRAFYRIAAVWLGVFNFLFLGAAASWAVYLVIWMARVPVQRNTVARWIFVAALVVAIYGFINAHRVRVKRIRVRLANLPASWRGRTAAVVSDLHLGHVHGAQFLGRNVATLRQVRPDIIFIPGDFFDGTKMEPDELAAALKRFSPKLGTYFVTGNHEEFSDSRKYVDALEGAGVRVLENEAVVVDGVAIVGVGHRDSGKPSRLQAVLESARREGDEAFILLSHAPQGLSIAEEAGVSLQISGHTHGGQIFPFTWFTRRIFGEYTHGLKRFGELMVYTSSGVGTWGPPMRVGTQPEIVLLEFE